jgi:arylsulfatase A-like enzyme
MKRYKSFILLTVTLTVVFTVYTNAQTTDSAQGKAATNVVLLVIDTLRPDHMSCYGYEKQTTSNIDKLAEEGFLFERCYSTSSWTLPACVSMLTGLYCQAHNANQWESKISEQLPFLPEILSDNGFYCMGVSSNPFLSVKQGFGRGFDVFDDTTVIASAEWSFPLTGSQYKSIVLASTGATATRRAMEFLNDRPQDKPFFLLVHYMDCHADYVPPPPYDTNFDPNYSGKITGHVQSQRFDTNIEKRDLAHIISLYDGEIAYTDNQVGQLLDHLKALELEKDTLVILTADHGEEFLEHGNWFHGHTLYEECVKVPLVIRWPGKIPVGKSSREVISLVDVPPTVLGALGVDLPKGLHGNNLFSIINGTGSTKERAVMIETALGTHLRSIVADNFKLITSAEYQAGENANNTDKMLFFDLALNPGEDTSRQIDNSRSRERLILNYANQVALLNKSTLQLDSEDTNEAITPDEGHLERLKSLGYIGN